MAVLLDCCLFPNIVDCLQMHITVLFACREPSVPFSMCLQLLGELVSALKIIMDAGNMPLVAHGLGRFSTGLQQEGNLANLACS